MCLGRRLVSRGRHYGNRSLAAKQVSACKEILSTDNGMPPSPYIFLDQVMRHTGYKWWLLESNGALMQLSERSPTFSPLCRFLYTVFLDMHLLKPSLCFLVCYFSSVTRASDREDDHHNMLQPVLLIMSTKSRISVKCGYTQLIAGNGEW